jgi:hypothetical protein
MWVEFNQRIFQVLQRSVTLGTDHATVEQYAAPGAIPAAALDRCVGAIRRRSVGTISIGKNAGHLL